MLRPGEVQVLPQHLRVRAKLPQQHRGHIHGRNRVHADFHSRVYAHILAEFPDNGVGTVRVHVAVLLLVQDHQEDGQCDGDQCAQHCGGFSHQLLPVRGGTQCHTHCGGGVYYHWHAYYYMGDHEEQGCPGERASGGEAVMDRSHEWSSMGVRG